MNNKEAVNGALRSARTLIEKYQLVHLQPPLELAEKSHQLIQGNQEPSALQEQDRLLRQQTRGTPMS